jgi:aminopeptidase N
VFHQASGEGYVFLREAVQKLDPMNPQVAARMVKPLTTWKRYDKERQAKMKHELEMILNTPGLSPDVYELVTKSLV